MTADAFFLSGRLAMVTGASRGIGLAMAEALARSGADVIGVSRKIDSGFSNRLSSYGVDSWGIACDLADPEGPYHLLETINNTVGRPVDILVNNAGMTVRKPALEQTDDDWDAVLNLNLRVPFILSREIGRTMVSQRRGKIIFTSSLMAYQGGILIPGYAASKGAVAQLAKALANEWAPYNVQVNALAPGYVQTEITAPLVADPTRSHDILARIPAGRWGRPEDLQGAVVFLASSASDYVTGTVLAVDGGWLAR